MKKIIYILFFINLLFARSLTTLSLESNATSLNIGENVALELIATYEDNSTKTFTSDMEWLISPTDSVKIAGTILTALKDGDVTLQAKVDGTLSNEITLNIYWEVDGYRLPPEPDKALNDSTLLGIDVNDNGVRDDVERWIYETYDEYIPCRIEAHDITLPDGSVVQTGKKVCEENAIPYHPIVRAIAMQGARAAQVIIQEPERAKVTTSLMDNAQDCSFYIFDLAEKLNNRSLSVKYIFDKNFEKTQFNTLQRARAYAKYNFNLSGGGIHFTKY
jgi:hypothetical protein